MTSIILIATIVLVVLVFLYCVTCKITTWSDARALRIRCQHLEQEQQRECRIKARLDQALEQQHVEHHLRELLASLHRLGQVMRGSEQYDAVVLDHFHALEATRFAYDRAALTLYSMALDHRVKLHDLLSIETDTQHLWSQYLAAAAR